MRKLFKYLGMYWKTVLLIFAVLFVQAYCDLSLPSYTSDIVNVGIQQGGIDETVPRAIAEEDMNRVLLFVTDEGDRQTVTNAYVLDENTYDKTAFVLKEGAEEDEMLLEELSDILGLPMLLTQGFSSGSEETQKIEEQMKEQFAEAQKAQAEAAMQQSPESMTPEQLAQIQQLQEEMTPEQLAQMQQLQDGDAQEAQPQMNIEEMDMFQILQIMPEEQVQMLVDEIRRQMSEMPDMIVEQAAISYVKTVYENLNMDVDSIQKIGRAHV